MPAITKRLIQAAKPRAKRYEVTCSRVRGLILRVLPSGKKVFYVRIRSGRSDNKIRIGLVGDITLEHAKQQAIRVVSLGEAKVGRHTTEREPDRLPGNRESRSPKVPAQEEPTVTFDELAIEFGRRHIETSALRERTRDYYRRAIRDFRSLWGTKPLHAIHFADVEEFHRAHAKHPSAANNAVRVLAVAFEKAIQWEMFDGRNPARGVKLFRENKRKRYLSPAEHVRLDRVLGDALHPREAGKVDPKRPYARWSQVYAIRLLLLTGFRKSEIFALKWSWIDRENLEIRLPDSKTGRSERVISPAVIELLDEIGELHRDPNIELVLYSQRGRKMSPSSMNQAWDRIRKAAELDDMHLHDLRHSAASAAISSGCSLTEVGAMARTIVSLPRGAGLFTHDERRAGVATPGLAWPRRLEGGLAARRDRRGHALAESNFPKGRDPGDRMG